MRTAHTSPQQGYLLAAPAPGRQSPALRTQPQLAEQKHALYSLVLLADPNGLTRQLAEYALILLAPQPLRDYAHQCCLQSV